MDRLNMPADIFTPRDPNDVIAALRDAGFKETEIRRPNSGNGKGRCDSHAKLLERLFAGSRRSIGRVLAIGCGQRHALQSRRSAARLASRIEVPPTSSFGSGA
ncbi:MULTISPECIES: hypothetical protein [unclassified Mesorhizobium]|uniref:hypothetical protein n=1 Tax=unclassified Mesorhizobium TaxID=325217 RepID=UPI000BAF7A12|nr:MULTISPECIES: hypothetical protein [unclassified Mesorhizobium]PBB23946.1 hypothetical protein CK232_24520 [Mesorhizobium sp. WSM4304]PBB72894.1 hypothetical protein CK227_24845 [Mesorhizobium sp. WSM4308]